MILEGFLYSAVRYCLGANFDEWERSEVLEQEVRPVFEAILAIPPASRSVELPPDLFQKGNLISAIDTLPAAKRFRPDRRVACDYGRRFLGAR